MLDGAAVETGNQAQDAVLNGGEDYELLFTSKPSADENEINRIARSLKLPISRIGVIKEASYGCLIIDLDGKREHLDGRGWDHFQR